MDAGADGQGGVEPKAEEPSAPPPEGPKPDRASAARPEDSDGPRLVQSISTRPELVVGLVAPLGTNLTLVTDSLNEALTSAGYHVEKIKLTDLLVELVAGGRFTPQQDLEVSPEKARIRSLQMAGNDFRTAAGPAAMSLLALSSIRHFRRTNYGATDDTAVETAFVISQFKRPEEIEEMRALFGDRFVLVGAASTRASRQASLSKKLAESRGVWDNQILEPDALELINIDEYESLSCGQDVRNTFPLADLFVDPEDEGATRSAVQRFIDLLFAHPFHTPSVDEVGMRLAKTMSLRSAAMGRQVGVSILREDGTVISLGANDVPKAGGGVYWPGDEADARDHVLGIDSTNKLQQMMVSEMLETLSEAGWLADKHSEKSLSDLVKLAIDDKLFKGTRALSLVEFGRTLHAEMNAILDAGRYGATLQEGVLYTTTFPCHECTRHIIGAGIKKVVFIEPYPKSLADTLHSDAITMGNASKAKSVEFQPFVGVAPRRFDQLFEMTNDNRKDGTTGLAREWTASTSALVPEDRWGPVVAWGIEGIHIKRFWSDLESSEAAAAEQGPAPERVPGDV